MAKQSLDLVNYIKTLGTTILHCEEKEIPQKTEEIGTKIKEFINASVSLASVDADGKTALMHACELGNFIAVDALRKYQQTIKLFAVISNHSDIDAISNEGVSALGYAVKFPDNGSDNLQRDEKSESQVVDLSMIKRRRQIVDMLIESKAKHSDWTMTQNKKEKKHVLGEASAAGNLYFLQQYFKLENRLATITPDETLTYFAPLALQGGAAIFDFWLFNGLIDAMILAGEQKTIVLFNRVIKENNTLLINKFIEELRKREKANWVSLIDDSTMETVLTAHQDTKMLEHIIRSYRNSPIDSSQDDNVSYPTSAPFHINLGAAFLLKTVHLGGNIEIIKCLVQLMLNAFVPNGTLSEWMRINTALELARQRGYLDAIKEILKLNPLFTPEERKLPLKFVEKINPTPIHQRIESILLVVYTMKTTKSITEVLLDKMHYDDFACLSDHRFLKNAAVLTTNERDAILSIIKTIITKRIKASESKETLANAPASSSSSSSLSVGLFSASPDYALAADKVKTAFTQLDAHIKQINILKSECAKYPDLVKLINENIQTRVETIGSGIVKIKQKN